MVLAEEAAILTEAGAISAAKAAKASSAVVGVVARWEELFSTTAAQ